MAEALALGASVAGFIGLAGQILQGCLFVQSFLEGLEDAPADVEVLRSELLVFQTSLDAFQSTLNVVGNDAISEDIGLALEYSNKIIMELRKVVSKLGDKGPGCMMNFSMVMQKVRISKHVKTLERARTLLLCAQMNLTFRIGHKQAQASRADSKQIKALVRRTQHPTNAAQLRPIGTTRRNTTLKPRKISQQTFGSNTSHTLPSNQELQNAMRHILENPSTSKDQNRIQTVEINSLADAKDDKLFNFGDCSGLPAEIVEMAKDTIRGVLVDYHAQNGHPGFGDEQSLTMISDKNIVEGPAIQFGLPRYRRILQQSSHKETFERALGLVTVTAISTQWRLGDSQSAGSGWSYTETKCIVSLDLDKAWLHCRLFCSTTSRSKLHYQPNFDPVLRVCNWIKHDAEIVVACRNGDLPTVRTLFASRLASPFDRSEKLYKLSLLDIVFAEIRLYLNQPITKEKCMRDLCQLFKYLVEQGLDPGELLEQHTVRKFLPGLPGGRAYTLTCSFCFSEVRGKYHDCKFCAGGYVLCEDCLSSGRRCMDLKHHNPKRLRVWGTSDRIVEGHSPIDCLASIDYTKEFASFLVEIARTILSRSVQDPFEWARLHELAWYKETAGVESPVFSLIIQQEDWLLDWKEQKHAQLPRYIPAFGSEGALRDPNNSLFRAWIRSTEFRSNDEKLDCIAWSLGQLRALLEEDKHQELIACHISACIDSDATFLWEFLVPALAPVLQRHGRLSLLYEALRRSQEDLPIEENKWVIEEYSTGSYWCFYPQSLKKIQNYFVCD
ncbi:hypothetical protein V8E51_001132 [Hyaloscypha variabilis]